MRFRTLFVIGIALNCFSISFAASQNPTVNFALTDFHAQAAASRRLEVYPLWSQMTNGSGGTFTGDRFVTNTTGIGTASITNVQPGAYMAILIGPYLNTTNFYLFPATNGILSAGDYVVPGSIQPGVIGYSRAQADSKFWSKAGLLPGLNTSFSTNAAGVVFIDTQAGGGGGAATNAPDLTTTNSSGVGIVTNAYLRTVFASNIDTNHFSAATMTYLDSLRRTAVAQFATNASNATNFWGLLSSTNLPYQSRQVIDPRLAPFNAMGDGIVDDTAALQAAVWYAETNALKLKTIALGRAAYAISTPLKFTAGDVGVKIIGEGGGDVYLKFSDAATVIYQKSTSDTDGIQMINSPGKVFSKIVLQDFLIVGNTNLLPSATNCGVRMDEIPASNSGTFRHCLISGVSALGWATGFKMNSGTGVRFQDCSSAYNLTNAFWLQQADTTIIENCWGGWGYFDSIGQSANDRCVALRNDTPGGGYGAGLNVHLIGGEWGNCYQFIQGDTCDLTILGGNRETFFSPNGSIVLTNQCRFVDLNPNWVGGLRGSSTVLPYRFTCGSAPVDFSYYKILGVVPNGYSAPHVSVEGANVVSPRTMPWVAMGESYIAGGMVYKATVGGSVTKSYTIHSAVDANYNNFFNAYQTFNGADASAGPAVIIPNGWQYGALNVGADDNANTVTANSNKWFEITGPSYSGTSYNVALMLYRALTGSHQLYFGYDLGGQTAVTHLNFGTASAVGGIGTGWWQIGPSGSLSALNSALLLGSGAKFTGNLTNTGTLYLPGLAGAAGLTVNADGSVAAGAGGGGAYYGPFTNMANYFDQFRTGAVAIVQSIGQVVSNAVGSVWSTNGNMWVSGFGSVNDFTNRSVGAGVSHFNSQGKQSSSAVVESDITLSDVTTDNSSTGAHGFLKKLDNTATHYMDGTGAWSTPPSGSGGVTTSGGFGTNETWYGVSQFGTNEASGVFYIYADGTWRQTNSTTSTGAVFTNGVLTTYNGSNLTTVSNLLVTGWAEIDGAQTNKTSIFLTNTATGAWCFIGTNTLTVGATNGVQKFSLDFATGNQTNTGTMGIAAGALFASTVTLQGGTANQLAGTDGGKNIVAYSPAGVGQKGITVTGGEVLLNVSMTNYIPSVITNATVTPGGIAAGSITNTGLLSAKVLATDSGGKVITATDGSGLSGVTGATASTLAAGATINPSDAGALTNINGGALTGYVHTINIDGSALWPADTATAVTQPTWYTNAASGYGFSTNLQSSMVESLMAWAVSQTATNRWKLMVEIPQYYGGGAVTAAVCVVNGTNSAAQSKLGNVWSVASCTMGAAMGTPVRFTNNLAAGTSYCETNWVTSGITIGGTPVAKKTAMFYFESDGGSPSWTSTNNEWLVSVSLTWPLTNALRSTMTVP